MTAPDAVVNAPVTRSHREEALRVIAPFLCDADYIKGWVQDGMWSGTAWAILDGTAQSLANLEAAVRREYEGLVLAAEARRAELEEERCELWTDAEAQIFKELETLKNG